MIASMTKYSFILLNGQQDGFLEKLQEIGLVDITRSVKPADNHSHEMMGNVDLITGLISGLEKIELPEGIQPEAIDGDIVRLAGGMLMRYSDDTQAIQDLKKEIDNLEVWGEFDSERLQELSDAGVPINFHVLPTKQFKPEWAEEYALSVVRTDKEKTWFVVAGSESLPGKIRSPKADIAAKKKELEEKEAHFQKVLCRVAGAKERIGELKQRRADDCTVLDRYLAAQAAVPAAEDTLVTFVGYVPTENEEAVTAAIDQMDVFYFKDKAKVEDNPPISFRNNKFVRMFEVLTDMYGRPAYDGFDPTPFIAVFFLLFFAFCMGDAGYGLLLILRRRLRPHHDRPGPAAQEGGQLQVLRPARGHPGHRHFRHRLPVPYVLLDGHRHLEDLRTYQGDLPACEDCRIRRNDGAGPYRRYCAPVPCDDRQDV